MKFIPNAVTLKVARKALVVRKHSPAILFGAGVVGTVSSTVLACRATLKIDEVLDDTKKKLVDVQTLEHKDYSDADRRQDVYVVRIQAATKIAKLYAPAIAVGVVSIGCLAGSHQILSKRNAGLTAAYAALEKGYNQYRQRVLEEVGEDKEREFRYGTHLEDVKNESTGKTKKVKKLGDGHHSIYARFFDEWNKNWVPTNPDYNFLFLKAQQAWANNRLEAYGYLLLNDVYDTLGLERSKEGCVVGWVKDGSGDGYVDFGIFTDERAEQFHNFVRHGEPILLDFNVDGIVYDKI